MVIVIVVTVRVAESVIVSCTPGREMVWCGDSGSDSGDC